MNAYEQIGNDETIMTNLYRYAVIARIFGISPDENMDIKELSDKSRREMRVDDFNEGINRLAMLFGAGFIDEDTFCFMEKNCIDYRADLKAAEDLIVSQNDAAPEDKTTPALIQNALRCAAYSKKYKEMQAVSFNEALQMTERTHIYIKDGVMRARDKEFLAFLADIGEPMGHLQDNGVYVENKSNIEQMALDENTVCDDFPVIFRMRSANIYSALFDKIYGKEFIRYAKENKIPLDDKNCDMKYRKYIERVKLHFDIRHYERKRQICGDTVNWFDYAPSIDGTITDNLKGLTEMKSVDLEETQHYDEDTLIEKAAAKYRNTYAFGAEAVIEVYHNSKEMLFTVTDGRLVEVDKEKFHRQLFDFDKIWGIIQMCSRNGQIRKMNDRIVIPEDIWNEISPDEREYADRLIKEQYSRQLERRKSNKLIMSLSALKASAENARRKKDELSAKQKAAEQRQNDKKEKREDGVET